MMRIGDSAEWEAHRRWVAARKAWRTVYDPAGVAGSWLDDVSASLSGGTRCGRVSATSRLGR
jgi:hypothetical protein